MLVIFRFQKIVLHHKSINKTRSTKNQENSVSRKSSRKLSAR